MKNESMSASQLTLTDRILLGLFRTFPPREHDLIFKASSSRPESEYDDEKNNPFTSFFVDGMRLVQGKDILDLGCGFGGRSVRFLELGASQVTGLEVDEERVRLATEFAASRSSAGVSFVRGIGESLPFKADSFDTVIMYDVMEHVIDPARVLAECYRVLRPRGRLATVFPPYYDLKGGSHLHGYATSFPGLNIVFSSQALKSAARRLLKEKGIAYEDYFREVPTDKLWNMNGLTVGAFNRLLSKSAFHKEQLIYHAYKDWRLKHYRALGRLISFPLFAAAHLPVLREVFCTRVCALLRK
jgi:SAM-dependent methyltransferase